MLIGEDALARLANSRVAVFGLGGVGGIAVEALARSGIGSLVIVDSDTVEKSNINRQLVAFRSTVGKSKVREFEKRIYDINPDIDLIPKEVYFSAETANEFDFGSFDYVIDAIDSVASKLELVQICKERGRQIVSSMGMGKRIDPLQVSVCDIYKTVNCPIATIMRKELRKRDIKELRVVASTEKPISTHCDEDGVSEMPRAPASMMIVPSVAGLLLANEAISHIIGQGK